MFPVFLEIVVDQRYSWKQSDGSRLDLTGGLGVEVNVDTDGEDVGEGIIALGGISWAFP